ncbi:succinate dehydrogenase [Bacillus sp. V3-13]|uniref:succinate dehydrogenase cytochrome b558 subunit n=1 Tax=Bacillus sp. V3-13 TaxID=2053728 RepID=UPI000C774304|nr:succinate dehydrogenase cytochrome b558 subunit [Bacillus sp. V3-13]PLR75909.1 succinate dehydrogenase [Bacillus sp. V3-13]
MQPNSVSAASYSAATRNKRFVLSRLHSLAGLLPLGIFLVEHLLSNALAVFGAERYNEHIQMLQGIPFLPLIEIFFIALPLVFHAVYGIYLSFMSKPNAHIYKHQRNLAFLLQRVTGVVTLIFVSFHVWSFRLGPLFTGTEVNHQLVSGHLANPLIFIFYLAGVLSAIFHFTNGISTGLITWGITVGSHSQKVAQKICLGLFILFGGIGVASLVSFI